MESGPGIPEFNQALEDLRKDYQRLKIENESLKIAVEGSRRESELWRLKCTSDERARDAIRDAAHLLEQSGLGRDQLDFRKKCHFLREQKREESAALIRNHGAELALSLIHI